MLSYPRALVAADGARSWLAPQPADFRDQCVQPGATMSAGCEEGSSAVPQVPPRNSEDQLSPPIGQGQS